DERDAVLAASIGTRTNRRHKPGRAWERTQYRFDILCDYGAFRDLQRHRPLTIEWQRLSPSFGYELPTDVEAAGLRADWERLMERSKETHDQIAAGGLLDAAQYAVAMGYRIRFVLQMTAREAMHLAELRSQPQGHPTYRRVAQAIHRESAAVHPAIGEASTSLGSRRGESACTCSIWSTTPRACHTSTGRAAGSTPRASRGGGTRSSWRRSGRSPTRARRRERAICTRATGISCWRRRSPGPPARRWPTSHASGSSSRSRCTTPSSAMRKRNCPRAQRAGTSAPPTAACTSSRLGSTLSGRVGSGRRPTTSPDGARTSW